MADQTTTRFHGPHLLKARKNAKLSRFQLTQKIDFEVMQGTIWAYETGRSCPSLNVAIKLARALKVPLKELTTDAKG